MPLGDVLKNFRDGGYKSTSKKEEDPGEEKQPESSRSFKLTDDEAKELQGYSKGPGMEQECLVTGRMAEDGMFSVTSVHSPEGGGGMDDEMAKAMMGPQGGPPLIQNQTMPSPS